MSAMTLGSQGSSKRHPHCRTDSGLEVIKEDGTNMPSDPVPIPGKAKSHSELTSLADDSQLSPTILPNELRNDSSASYLGDASPSSRSPLLGGKTSIFGSTPPSPGLSRTASFSNMSGYNDDWDGNYPPLDRLTVFDVLENIALPQRLEKWQSEVKKQTDKVRRHQQRIKSASGRAREQVVEEWRRRVPTSEEQLDKYRKRMRNAVDRLGKQWNDSKTITIREKASFIAGVMNIFLSGYLIGANPEYFHWWYTAQLLYYMPIRYYTYHSRGYHYFLADLCYFVNLLLALSIWAFPNSKRLFIATYCLAFGNNAVAIVMWRNSLVFHSLDKVTR